MRKIFLSASILAASIFGFAGVASAEPPTPVDQVTTMATDAASTLTPILVAVGGALVTVAAISFGVRWVLRLAGRGGRA